MCNVQALEASKVLAVYLLSVHINPQFKEMKLPKLIFSKLLIAQNCKAVLVRCRKKSFFRNVEQTESMVQWSNGINDFMQLRLKFCT